MIRISRYNGAFKIEAFVFDVGRKKGLKRENGQKTGRKTNKTSTKLRGKCFHVNIHVLDSWLMKCSRLEALEGLEE